MRQQQPREDLARLASYVISARIAAGYATRKDFAAAIGVTARTLGKLETASEPVSSDTLARVANGLGWTPDSPARVLTGLEPRTLSLIEGTADPDEIALAKLVAKYPDDDIMRRIATRGGADAATRRREAEWWEDAHYQGNGTAG